MKGRRMPYLWPTDLGSLGPCLPRKDAYPLHEWRLAYRDTESANPDHRYARYYCIYCLQQVDRDLNEGLGAAGRSSVPPVYTGAFPALG